MWAVANSITGHGVQPGVAGRGLGILSMG